MKLKWKWLNKLITFSLLTTVTILAPLTMTSCSNSQLIFANTIYGSIAGTLTDGIYNFKGVPYAQSPIGNLKFAPPLNPKPWVGVKDCTKWGEACIQDDQGTGWDIQPQGDDCLNLNIWTPSLDSNKKLPVYVYIHGGVFTIGSAHQDVFDGHYLSKDGDKNDMVVVTVNYRLHALGFMALNYLWTQALNDLDQPVFNDDGTPIKTNGNWGLLDQIKALQWVHKNIINFGGDPNNVTIAGESAGSFSVSSLILSPATDPTRQSDGKDLFQHAVMESGNLMGYDSISSEAKGRLENPWYNPNDVSSGRAGAIQICDDLIREKIGFSDSTAGVRALRLVPSEWLAEWTKINWTPSNIPSLHTYNLIPSYDGWALPYTNGKYNGGDVSNVDHDEWWGSVQWAFAEAKFRNVDVLWGWNTGEGYGFYPNDGTCTMPETLADIEHIKNNGGPDFGNICFANMVADKLIDGEGDSFPYNIDSNSYKTLFNVPSPTKDGDWTTYVHDYYSELRDLTMYSAFVASTKEFVDQMIDSASKHSMVAKQHYMYTFDYFYWYPSPYYQNTTLDGAAHTAELPFVFGTTFDNPLSSDNDKIASQTIMNYWTNFAKTGNPNGIGLPSWTVMPNSPITSLDSMYFRGGKPYGGSETAFTNGMDTITDADLISVIENFYENWF